VAGILFLSGRNIAQAPGIEERVAPDYERFDGLEPYAPDEGSNLDAPAHNFRPGALATHAGGVGGIAGKVGSVGASPLPVADCVHRSEFLSVEASLLTTQFRFGPGGAAPGIAATLAMTDLLVNPPAIDELSVIFAGI